MKNKLANTKSQLAKLMASENITVQHQNVPTASFDVKNRVLTIPNLEDGLDVNLYDLMTSHEVGHALWTPEEGWHDAVAQNGPVFKGFVNVIEDARIEKKIKAKYPGLKTAYRDGYKELVDRDFFGIAGKDITEMAFIDRLNLHFKLGTLVNLQFEGQEAEWVEKIEAAETFEDVMAISEGLYGQQIEQAEEELEEEVERLVNATSGNDEENDDTEETQKSQNSDEDPEDETDEDFGGGSTGDDVDDDYEDDDFDFDDLDDDDATTPEEKIESQTDKSFRANEGSLTKNDGKEFEYLTLGNIASKDFVLPFSDVNKKYNIFN